MGRGPGRIQREILAEIEAAGHLAVPVTSPAWSRARNESRRRAARQLESRGLIAVSVLNDGRLSARDAGDADRARAAAAVRRALDLALETIDASSEAERLDPTFGGIDVELKRPLNAP